MNTTVDSIAGTVQLAPGQVSGQYTTVEIIPTGFGRWNTLTVNGTFSSFADVMIEVLDQSGIMIILPPQSPSPLGTVNLSTIDPVMHPAIRVRVLLSASGGPAPVIDSLEVAWNPVSLLLVAVAAPATAVAGEPFVCRIRLFGQFCGSPGVGDLGYVAAVRGRLGHLSHRLRSTR